MLLSLRKHRHDLKHNQSQPLSADGVQQVTATGGTNLQETKEARENRAVLQPLAAGCETLPSSQVLGESNYYAISRGTAQTPLN